MEEDESPSSCTGAPEGRQEAYTEHVYDTEFRVIAGPLQNLAGQENFYPSKILFAHVWEFPLCCAIMPAFANCCPFHRLFTCSRRNVLRFQALLKRRYVSHRIQCARRAVLATPAIYLPSFPLRLAAPDHGMVHSRQRTQSYASGAVEPLLSPYVKIVSVPLRQQAHS